jgi:hypothetical protein
MPGWRRLSPTGNRNRNRQAEIKALMVAATQGLSSQGKKPSETGTFILPFCSSATLRVPSTSRELCEGLARRWIPVTAALLIANRLQPLPKDGCNLAGALVFNPADMAQGTLLQELTPDPKKLGQQVLAQDPQRRIHQDK